MLSGLGKEFRSLADCDETDVNNVKDPVNARFQACALPYISLFPALVAACLLLAFSRRFLPRGLRRPQWLEPFIKESDEDEDLLRPKWMRRQTYTKTALLVLSNTGLILQCLTTFYPAQNLFGLYAVAAWVSH